MRGGSNDVPAMVTVPASASLNIITSEDVNDDVFDTEENSTSGDAMYSGLTPGATEPPQTATPSPTGYRDYKPPAEVFTENYGYPSAGTRDYNDIRDGLKRSKQEDTGLAHKTILLGDSGVGKTSLLVQFDTGRFQHGNFAATVGIGFTARRRSGRRRSQKRRKVKDLSVPLFLWSKVD